MKAVETIPLAKNPIGAVVQGWSQRVCNLPIRDFNKVQFTFIGREPWEEQSTFAYFIDRRGNPICCRHIIGPLFTVDLPSGTALVRWTGSYMGMELKR